MAEQIGAAAADTLAMDWGGQVISIPHNHYYKLAARDRKVLQEHQDGVTIAKLALKYRMTERGLRMLIRRAEVRDFDSRQIHLFPEGDVK